LSQEAFPAADAILERAQLPRLRARLATPERLRPDDEADEINAMKTPSY
jgi:hypothetical protein